LLGTQLVSVLVLLISCSLFSPAMVQILQGLIPIPLKALLTEGDVTLVEVDQTVTSTVAFANPTPSLSPSASQTATQTASTTNSVSSTKSASASRTPSQTASQSSTSSQSSAASQLARHTASQTSLVTPSASTSASAKVVDPCDDHICASGAGCVVVDNETQYMCNCTAISTAAVRRVGRYCNTTVEGKPVSVGDGSANCPGCASLFVTGEGFDGNDPDAYLQSIIPLLAAAYCVCPNPPQALLNQFGAVQFQVQADGSFTVEFTIYSGNPDATTAADIVGALKDDPPMDLVVRTKRPKEFLSACEDDKNGCIDADVDSDGNSMVFIIIGAAAACVVLAFGIVWYCLHKRVNQQFQARTWKPSGSRCTEGRDCACGHTSKHCVDEVRMSRSFLSPFCNLPHVLFVLSLTTYFVSILSGTRVLSGQPVNI
jgi:hypothetical protein